MEAGRRQFDRQLVIGRVDRAILLEADRDGCAERAVDEHGGRLMFVEGVGERRDHELPIIFHVCSQVSMIGLIERTSNPFRNTHTVMADPPPETSMPHTSGSSAIV